MCGTRKRRDCALQLVAATKCGRIGALDKFDTR